jgi:hypothetical protein
MRTRTLFVAVMLASGCAEDLESVGSDGLALLAPGDSRDQQETIYLVKVKDPSRPVAATPQAPAAGEQPAKKEKTPAPNAQPRKDDPKTPADEAQQPKVQTPAAPAGVRQPPKAAAPVEPKAPPQKFTPVLIAVMDSGGVLAGLTPDGTVAIALSKDRVNALKSSPAVASFSEATDSEWKKFLPNLRLYYQSKAPFDRAELAAQGWKVVGHDEADSMMEVERVGTGARIDAACLRRLNGLKSFLSASPVFVQQVIRTDDQSQ